MNLWGAIEGRVLRRASESALQKIITLIREAQGMRAPSQRFIDRFGTTYTWASLSLCFVMFFLWWLVFDLPSFLPQGGRASAFYRAMTLLVVASPCALAGALGALFGALGDRLRRSPRRSFPRRCGCRDTRRRQRGRLRQDGHSDIRRIDVGIPRMPSRR
jgi:hypothetical protein